MYYGLIELPIRLPLVKHHFQLVYEQKVVLPIELELLSLHITLLFLDYSLRDQYVQLEKLDEVCQYVLQNIEVDQRRWTYYYDGLLKPK
jgi:hypothetical protein